MDIYMYMKIRVKRSVMTYILMQISWNFVVLVLDQVFNQERKN